MRTFWCEQAWLPAGVAGGVEVQAGSDGRIVAVRTGVAPAPGAHRLAGLVLPGAANTHSHAFHRALRGRTQGSTFTSWRKEMYDVAGRLDPDRYLALATAVYAELVVAGWTCVGEFHYLHHAPGGPTAMADALRAAADRARIRLTLLDTCYLTGGFGAGGIATGLGPEQARFGDAKVAGWADRLAGHPPDSAMSRTGAAIHSVRAVPREVLPEVVVAAGTRPLHVHLAEQASEVAGCRAAYGVSPARLLYDSGVLGPRTTAVHAPIPPARQAAGPSRSRWPPRHPMWTPWWWAPRWSQKVAAMSSSVTSERCCRLRSARCGREQHPDHWDR